MHWNSISKDVCEKNMTQKQEELLGELKEVRAEMYEKER